MWEVVRTNSRQDTLDLHDYNGDALCPYCNREGDCWVIPSFRWKKSKRRFFP